MTQCVICKKFKTTDGDWVRITATEIAIAIMNNVPFKLDYCPDCKELKCGNPLR